MTVTSTGTPGGLNPCHTTKLVAVCMYATPRHGTAPSTTADGTSGGLLWRDNLIINKNYNATNGLFKRASRKAHWSRRRKKYPISTPRSGPGSHLLRGEGHDWAHRCGRLQHVVPREVLRRGTDGNLRLGDLEADLGPLGHRLEADAPLNQRLSPMSDTKEISQVRRVRRLHLAFMDVCRSILRYLHT